MLPIDLITLQRFELKIVNFELQLRCYSVTHFESFTRGLIFHVFHL